MFTGIVLCTMVKMAASFSDDEYEDLGHLSIENANRFLSDCDKGVPLRCWGKAGYQLPRLPEIFIPRQVLTCDADEDPDPAFRTLSKYRGAEQSFSIYGDANEFCQDLNNLDSSADEIYCSDSDYSTKNEDLSEDEDSACNPYDSNEKVINSLPCKDKINEIDHLNSNHFESSKPSHIKVFGNSQLTDVPQESSEQWRKEISFMVEEEGKHEAKSIPVDQEQELESEPSFPIASFALGKKTKEEVLLPQKKKQAKAKKRASNKKTHGHVMLSESVAVERECERNVDIDELQRYYRNFGNYDRTSFMPILSSENEFPELLASPRRDTPRTFLETNQMCSSRNEPQKLDFQSVTESFLPTPAHDDQEIEEYVEKQEENNQDLLIIENIPFGLPRDHLISYLETFGIVQDLSLEVNDTDITATAIMDCDLDWVIEALDGNSLEGAEYDFSKPLLCYKVKGDG